MRVLLTGSSGFVGKNLCDSMPINYFVRVVREQFENESKYIYGIDRLNSSTDWEHAFEGVSAVIHLAGVAHNKQSDDTDFDEVNNKATLHLAREAVKSGVKRFVFVSSIGVNGSSTNQNPFSDTSNANPHNAYAQSKFNAEIGLKKIARATGLEVVIVRPTLVYGVNAPGNFGLLTKLVTKLPLLPFGLVNNKRDFIAVQNLVDLLLTCVKHPSAPGHIFLASDGKAVSIKEFTNGIAKGVGTKLIQLPVPVSLMRFAGQLLGKSTMIEQLVGNLEVDSSNLFKVLGWTPPYTMEESMSFLKQEKKSIFNMIRLFDFITAFLGLLLLWPILLLVIIIGFFDTGSPIFIQTRVGKNKKAFKLIKLRTMTVGTKSVASHLATNSSITKLGNFLRKTKIDELPQLVNVVKGEMSLVGPRPNLFNQEDLIKERDALGVYDVLPGVTGLAQVQNIDMSTPVLLAKTDKQMIETLTVKNYFKYIIMTITGSGSGDAVKPK